MNKKIRMAVILGMILSAGSGCTGVDRNSAEKPTASSETGIPPEVNEPLPSENSDTETIPTFVFDDLEVKLEDVDRFQKISISDPAAGCYRPAKEEIPYPDEAALHALVDQLVKAINDRDADLYNTLRAREEDQVEFMLAAPKIQEYEIHYYTDGLVAVDLTWLDCDQTLYSQYRITLKEASGLKIDTMQEKIECQNRAGVMLGDDAELIREFTAALQESDYFALLALYPGNTPCSEEGYDMWKTMNMKSVQVVESSLAGNYRAALIEVDTEDPGCTQLAQGKHRYCLVMEKTGNSFAIEGLYLIQEEKA